MAVAATADEDLEKEEVVVVMEIMAALAVEVGGARGQSQPDRRSRYMSSCIETLASRMRGHAEPRRHSSFQNMMVGMLPRPARSAVTAAVTIWAVVMVEEPIRTMCASSR